MKEQIRLLFSAVAVSTIFLIVPHSVLSQNSTDIRIITGINRWIFASGEGDGRVARDKGFSIGGGISKPVTDYLSVEYNALYFHETFCLLGYGEYTAPPPNNYVAASRFWNHVWQNQFAIRLLDFFKLGLTYDVTLYRSSERSVFIDDAVSICLYTGPGDEFIYHTLNLNFGFGFRIKKRIGIEFDYIRGLTPWYIQGKPTDGNNGGYNSNVEGIEGSKVFRRMYSFSLIYFIHLKKKKADN